MKRQFRIATQIFISVLLVGVLIACTTPTATPTAVPPTAVPPTAVVDALSPYVSRGLHLTAAAGTDRLRRKNSHPELMGLEPSKKFAHTLAADAIQALAGFDAKADPLRALAAFVVERNK